MALFDIHLHTRNYSDCSFINPEELVRRAVEVGLNGIALTEHGMRWPDDKFDTLRRLADPHGLILINGQEIYTASDEHETEGEFLVFGLKKSIVRMFPAKELVDRVHGEGGILIAAHPYKLSRNGRFKYYGAGDRIYELDIDAVEFAHPDHKDHAIKKIRHAMEKLGLPGTGGSDAHKIFSVGSFVTVFRQDVFNEIDFIEQIRSKAVRGEKGPVRNVDPTV